MIIKANFYEQKIIKVNKFNNISMDSLKKFLKIQGNEDDELLAPYLETAVDYAEKMLGYSLRQTRKIFSYKAPIVRHLFVGETIIKVHRITAISSDGKETIYKGESIVEKFERGCIRTSKVFENGDVYAECDVGFLADEYIPNAIILAILMHVGQMYETGFSLDVPPFTTAMLNAYKKRKI